MLHWLAMLQQTAPSVYTPGWWSYVVDFIDSPAPYSPFSEYLLVLFILWLLARREEAARRRKDFGFQAQEVLDEKYQTGELSKEAYDRFRQDTSMAPR